MKVRSDFVTNSSSSSFVIARKPQLSEAQKEAVINFVEQNLLGKLLLTPDSTEEEIQKVFEEEWEFREEKTQIAARAALAKGQSIYSDLVGGDLDDCTYAGIFGSLWTALGEADGDSFKPIYDDVSYLRWL